MSAAEFDTNDDFDPEEAVFELLAALRDAREMVSDWAAYASEYFCEKWNLAGDLADLDAVLAKYDDLIDPEDAA